MTLTQEPVDKSVFRFQRSVLVVMPVSSSKALHEALYMGSFYLTS